MFRKIFLLVALSIILYWSGLFLLWSLESIFPKIRIFIDIPLSANGTPKLFVIALPFLGVSITCTAILIEIFIGSKQALTFKWLTKMDHPSVRMDVFYFLMRISGLTILAAVIFSFGTLPFLTHWIHRTFNFHFLDKAGPWPVQMVLLLIVSSFGFYVYHRILHTRWFWEVHKVHHSATVYNVLLPYRNHPLDYCFAHIVFGLFSAVAGGTPEAAIGAMAINALYQSMVHSMTDWSPKWLEYIFITPATHRVHHSMNPTHFNKNFGTLSFWDKLFGTYHPPDEVTSFGVDDRENFNHDRFGAEIFLVVKRWIRTLLQT